MASKFVLITKCYQSHHKKGEMDRACSMHGRNEKANIYLRDYKGRVHFTDLGEGDRTQLK
jgi:hypothetical protein